jgi:hypothetical protein
MINIEVPYSCPADIMEDDLDLDQIEGKVLAYRMWERYYNLKTVEAETQHIMLSIFQNDIHIL